MGSAARLAEAAALPGTPPALRTPHDAEADRKEFAQNIAKQTYKEWPNEAGPQFDGLTEERGPLELTVRGHIPDWAAGSLYRTGPGACKVENSPKGTHYVTHWFDGFAHTHLFQIVPADEAAGTPLRVVYSSRRQAETLVSEIRAQGMRNAYSFGQRRDPCIGLFGKVMSMFQKQPQGSNVSVAVNTNVPGLSPPRGPPKGDEAAPSGGGHRNGVRNVWISTDASMLVEADPDTLEPVGVARQAKLHPDLKGPSSCAHAQRDPETGDLFNYNLDFGRTATYRVFRVSAATGKTDILATISDAGAKPGYMHSFFLTPSYVVLCIPVAHFGLAGLKVPWNRNLLDSIEAFDATQRCKWLVVDRRGKRGLVASFDTPAAFFFHSVNSFEETSPDGSGVDLFCDVVEYPNQDVIRSFNYDVLLDRNDAAKRFWGEENRLQTLHPRLARYRLGVPLTSGRKRGQWELVSSIPGPHAGELPVINPAYHTKRHRYVYSLANRGRSTLLDTVVKTDTETRGALLWGCPRGHTPGETIFVPRPVAAGQVADEDDGVLLSVVLDGSAQRSYLLCLNARDLTELGRAECPFAIGLGFHGVHAPTGYL
ncbi:hypothetical protein ACHAO3_001136 [Verticillium nonalfalfae]